MKKNIIVAIVLSVIVFNSCEELTEVDLSNIPIRIIAPIDSLKTTILSNTFAWENVTGAIKYQIQIVSPKFDSVTRFVVDSSVSKSPFTYSLSPGRYQWRIRAINTGTQTSYFLRNFLIQ
jgi:hypothetical protein